MFSSLETNIEDPAERLKAIADANSVAKQHSAAIGATLLQDWSQFAAPAVFGVAMRVYASSRLTSARPVHNLVVSNVPGPQVPLYFLGAQVNAMYPLGPIFHGSGLNITVMSLNGTLDVGLISCPELLPDLWDMADDFAVALQELLGRHARSALSSGRWARHGSMCSHEASERARSRPPWCCLLVAGCSKVVDGRAVIGAPRPGTPVHWKACESASSDDVAHPRRTPNADCSRSRSTTPSPTATSPSSR